MDVSTWLRGLGLDDYAQAFHANHTDAEVLARLTADDLTALGITSIGHRRRLLDAIARLDEALARVDRLEERWFAADLLGLKGEALLEVRPHQSAEAEACFHQALAVARDQGARVGAAAPRPASPGFGPSGMSGGRPTICSRPSTAGSPTVSTPRT